MKNYDTKPKCIILNVYTSNCDEWKIMIINAKKKKKKPHCTRRARGIRLLFYWFICKDRNWDVGWIVKWDDKIDKISS